MQYDNHDYGSYICSSLFLNVLNIHYSNLVLCRNAYFWAKNNHNFQEHKLAVNQESKTQR